MRAAICIAACLLAGCASGVEPRAAAPVPAPAPARAPAPAAPVQSRSIPVANAGFEAGMKAQNRCALSWDCTMHNDPASFRFSLLESGAAAGGRSLCVERVANEPWMLLTQATQDASLRGKRVRLSMQVRVEGATGAGAGPWLLAQARPVANVSRLTQGTSGWQLLSVELALPADAQVVEFGATLEGPGKACFDEVRLEVL